MSQDKDQGTAEGFGDYYPESAGHRPYSDAMAAWRNQVRAMQSEGTLPPAQESQDEPEEQERPEDPQERSESAQEAQTPMQASQEASGQQEGSQDSAEEPQGDATVEDGQEKVSQEQDDSSGSESEPKEVFDPSEHTVNDTLEHLKGVGVAEAERVLESEEAGKRRLGILNHRDELLAKARENDESGSGSKDA